MVGRRNPGQLEKAAAKIVGEVIESGGEFYAIRPAPHEQGGGYSAHGRTSPIGRSPAGPTQSSESAMSAEDSFAR